MKQILHIFAKDSRRFWPEILISLAITAAFAWTAPNLWLANSPNRGDWVVVQELRTLASLLTVLIPIGWLLLITRVVHAESLVGDRQFWLTRPYEWKKLLAAKLLFLLTYIYLPFLAAQCLLLLQAGFHPLSWVPALLYALLLQTGVVLLPFFALATVTSTFARLILTIIGLIVAAITIAALLSTQFHTDIVSPYTDYFSLPVAICICAAAIMLQYAARRTWTSRLILVALPIALAVIAICLTSTTAIDRAYPHASPQQDTPIHFAFLQDSTHKVKVNPGRNGNHVQVSLPFMASGVPSGYVVIADDVKPSITAANGDHWVGSYGPSWQNGYIWRYLPGQEQTSINFEMDRNAYEHLLASPVTLHLGLALTQAQAGAVRQVALQSEDFEVPGFGICSPLTAWGQSIQIKGISCRSALRLPPLTYVETLWSNEPCSGATPPSSIQGSGWAGGLGTALAGFGINPVSLIGLGFSNAQKPADTGGGPSMRYLCPGTPITFTQYHPVRRLQTDFLVQNLQLPPLS